MLKYDIQVRDKVKRTNERVVKEEALQNALIKLYLTLSSVIEQKVRGRDHYLPTPM